MTLPAPRPGDEWTWVGPCSAPARAVAAGSALSHLAVELVQVEIVPPGVDLAVADLEGPHDRQLKRLVGELEDIHPLGHHDRTIGRDVDDAELDALDTWQAGPDHRVDQACNRLPALYLS